MKDNEESVNYVTEDDNVKEKDNEELPLRQMASKKALQVLGLN